MTVLVTDNGFKTADWPPGFLTLEELRASDTAGHALHLENDVDPEDVREFFGRLAIIRVPFPSFADGRGFSIAKRLRLMGYKGILRAEGHVLADQYPHARRSGFDEIEIDEALAARQPEDQWLAHANWAEHDYQARLRQANEAA